MMVKSVGNYTNYTQKYNAKDKSCGKWGFCVCYNIFGVKMHGEE